MKRLALVLAAGEGTRMKSGIPKVLHRVCGRSMLSWVLGTLEELRDADLIHGVTVVIGNGADRVREEVGDRGVCVVQGERRGTGRHDHRVPCSGPLAVNLGPAAREELSEGQQLAAGATSEGRSVRASL